MKDKIIKFLLMLASVVVYLPAAYLCVSHGSSYGLELGIVLTVICIYFNVLVLKGGKL